MFQTDPPSDPKKVLPTMYDLKIEKKSKKKLAACKFNLVGCIYQSSIKNENMHNKLVASNVYQKHVVDQMEELELCEELSDCELMMVVGGASVSGDTEELSTVVDDLQIGLSIPARITYRIEIE